MTSSKTNYHTIHLNQLTLFAAADVTAEQMQHVLNVARRHKDKDDRPYYLGTREEAPEQGGLSYEQLLDAVRA